MKEGEEKDSIVVALEHVALALTNAGALLDSLKLAFQERTEKFGRMLRLQTYILLMMIMGSLVMTWSSLDTHATAEKIREVTNPTSQYAKEASQRTNTLLISLAEENDCRARRGKAGLPAPSSNTPCRAQTPPYIYPGNGE